MLICVPSFAATTNFKIDSSDEGLGAELKAAALSPAAGPLVQDVVAAAQADYSRLIGVLYARGYFGPIINITLDGREAASLSPLDAPRAVSEVAITVKPGRLFRFGRTAIAPLTPQTSIPESFAPDRPASTGAVQNAAKAAIDRWREIGHAKARVANQDIAAVHAQARLEVDLSLDPGPRLRFGNLNVIGNEAVRTDRIIDIAGLPSGRVFSPEEARRAANRLRRTGAFRAVSLTETEQPTKDDTLDFDVKLTEAPPRRLGFGAEISSLEGLALSGFWLHRNLLGGAERLRLDAEISGIGGESGGTDSELSLEFTRPATFNEDTDFFALAELERRNDVSFSSDNVSLLAGIRRYASPTRQYSFATGIRRERSKDTFGERDFTLWVFPISAQFDNRDAPLDPRGGYFANIELTPYLGLGGSASGLRSYADFRVYRSPSERLTFAMRGQIGSISGAGLEEAPADFLFFSGGGGTVRGQPYQSLGIARDGNDPSGGRAFLGLSAELRFKTSREKLSLVTFLDAGYIGAEAFPDAQSGDWHSGAGIGLRYDTGIGPIRVDLGLPVSGPGDNSGFELYIGIGQAF